MFPFPSVSPLPCKSATNHRRYKSRVRCFSVELLHGLSKFLPFGRNGCYIACPQVLLVCSQSLSPAFARHSIAHFSTDASDNSWIARADMRMQQLIRQVHWMSACFHPPQCLPRFQTMPIFSCSAVRCYFILANQCQALGHHLLLTLCGQATSRMSKVFSLSVIR